MKYTAKTENVLIILPQENQPEPLCETLARHGITTTLVEDIRSAILSLKSDVSSIVLLDMDIEGADLFLDSIVTNFYNPPPYLLAATGPFNSTMRTDVLNRGADACLEKPIDTEEVVAIIHAALRRAALVQKKSICRPPCLIRGEMLIDPAQRMVVMEGCTVVLTRKKFDALYLLASHPGVVFSQEQIYSHVWNEDYGFATTSISDLISSIRKKLGLTIKDRRYIQTLYNAGYRFVAE